MSLSTRHLLGVLFREEWRLHSRLFGGWRFALFPAVVAVVAVATAGGVSFVGTDTDVLVAGLHVVVVALGLQVGTVGLVGRDALEDLLGETTLLLFSARTLPIEPKRLLVAFLLKDLLYYAALFLFPLCVGLVPLVVTGDLSPVDLPLLFATTVGTFVVGAAASFALVGIYTRSRRAAVVVAVVAVATFLAAGTRVLVLTPYGLVDGLRPTPIVASLLATVVFVVVGIALFAFDRHDPVRTADERFDRLHRRLRPVDGHGVLAKSLLEVGRSSGGLWKVVFSQAIVFVVVAAILAYLPAAIPVRPAPGLTIAAVMALGTFTTYNWLCQFDDTRFYARYPVTMRAVFRAKLLAFCILALPVGVGFIALGVAVFGTETMLLGVVTFPPLSLYVFGVTAYLAGLEPTELLFDTPVFAGFTVATMAVLLPLVVAAIAFPLAPLRIAAGSLALSIAAGGVGGYLSLRAGNRWERKALAGTRREEGRGT